MCFSPFLNIWPLRERKSVIFKAFIKNDSKEYFLIEFMLLLDLCKAENHIWYFGPCTFTFNILGTNCAE